MAALLAALVLWASCTPLTHAQLPTADANIDIQGIIEDFDGVQPSLKITDDSSLAGIKLHCRTDRSPLRGRRSERLQLWGKRGGERVLAAQTIVPVAAISELEVNSWVKGNRPGFQIMLRVRLPRALDGSGKPRSLYLLGDRYRTPGKWQQLRVANFQTQFAQRIRAMRADARRPVDPAEAYVDQVVFNVFGGAEENDFWVDDLSVLAGIPVRAASTDTRHASRNSMRSSADWQGLVPRIAVYQGQPLADLARLGFNGVRFSTTPTPMQAETAQKHELRIVLSPASSGVIQASHVHQTSASATVSAHPLSTVDQQNPIRVLGTIDRTSVVTNGSANSPLPPASPLDAPAGSPSHTVDEEWTDLNATESRRWLPLRTQLRNAVFAGSTGFVFDPVAYSGDSAYRNAVAELVNLELTLFQPWILRTDSLERVVQPGSETSYPLMGMFSQHAGLLWVPRSELLATSNSVSSSSAPRRTSPAVNIQDASNRQAHFLAPGSVSPANSRRIPGGVRIALHRDNPHGLLLLTNQPTVLKAYADQLNTNGDRYNELFVRVIRFELIQLDRQLSEHLPDAEHVSHLRKELHALHSRLAPILESTATRVNYQQLDHFLGQLERVQQIMIAPRGH